MWDTEANNGVLIYLLLAVRDVEIVADRGVGEGRVPQAEWQRCCRVMQQYFAKGRFREGAIAGLQQVAAVLAQYPPGRPDHGNELPDRPAVLSTAGQSSHLPRSPPCASKAPRTTLLPTT